MRIKKRTVTIVETHAVTITRPLNANSHGCPECGCSNTLVSIDEASALTGISVGEFYQRVEQKTIHSAATASGDLLVCLNAQLF